MAALGLLLQFLVHLLITLAVVVVALLVERRALEVLEAAETGLLVGTEFLELTILAAAVALDQLLILAVMAVQA
jgi:hypothetical protein